MQDKGYNETTHGVCFSFVYVNHFPNHRAQGAHFERCKCFFVNNMHFTLNYSVTSNGRKKKRKKVLAAGFHIHWATD